MKNYIKHDPWKVIEEGFVSENNRISESLCSIGNGRFGQRANFEEKYSGDTLRGSYLAGVYYPDKTRVGWWKNGYPEYFAKVLNAANWIGINVWIDGEELDLATCSIESFSRVLHMDTSSLERRFVATTPKGKKVEVISNRFLSIVKQDAGAIEYSVTPLNFDGEITFEPYVDLDVVNEDSNYDEKFWIEVEGKAEAGQAYLIGETKKTGFRACTGMTYQVEVAGNLVTTSPEVIQKPKYVSNIVKVEVKKNEKATIHKFGVNLTSLYYKPEEMGADALSLLSKLKDQGFSVLFEEHKDQWSEKWKEADIKIEGDISAQQAIRFNILQLYQTYNGDDERLNIGPKGFTGEKYGGVTYWDTEAYCLPFYMRTADQQVARKLLVYRHKHLQKAIENAEKLGFKNGAALYPMVTINGEECHNEWEITFEEIHRNGAIAYAIYSYVNYTGDWDYLGEFGLDVLIGISRFWRQRVNWSEDKQKYVMLGVTGPNEYENNINNNWYTNTIACWTLEYTLEIINYLDKHNPERLVDIFKNNDFDELEDERSAWKHIVDNMHFPHDTQRDVFLQQDGFLDKELKTVSEIPDGEYPINQNWSWDRILRSCYIKQADVLQGLYFLENRFDKETIKRNFEFYEPMTVHESSLSPCIHSIIAANLGMEEKAYEMYLRTARLDLDDYNNDTEDGLHITSMAGTWMSVVEGFGGLRVKDDEVHLNPFIPKKWDSYDFTINFRGFVLHVKVTQKDVTIFNQSGQHLSLKVYDQHVRTNAGETVTVNNERQHVNV